jgi:hypothetical protein
MLRDYVDRGVWTVSDRPKAPDGAPTLRPAAFGDVALLFRGMTDVPIYEEPLKRYDIPYRVTSSRTVLHAGGGRLAAQRAPRHRAPDRRSGGVGGAAVAAVRGVRPGDLRVRILRRGAGLPDPPAAGAVPDSIAASWTVLQSLHEQRNV